MTYFVIRFMFEISVRLLLSDMGAEFVRNSNEDGVGWLIGRARVKWRELDMFRVR